MNLILLLTCRLELWPYCVGSPWYLLPITFDSLSAPGLCPRLAPWHVIGMKARLQGRYGNERLGRRGRRDWRHGRLESSSRLLDDRSPREKTRDDIPHRDCAKRKGAGLVNRRAGKRQADWRVSQAWKCVPDHESAEKEAGQGTSAGCSPAWVPVLPCHVK
jgi:hypothetical protein